MAKVVVFIAVFCLVASAKAAVPSDVAMIPAPARLARQSGPSLTIKDGSSIAIDANDPDALWIANYLKDLTQRTTGIALEISNDSREAASIRLKRSTTGAGSPESYRLDVDSRQATIEAGTRAGLFYGAVSLWQILTSDTSSSHKRALAPMKIEDRPSFQWRGFLLDSGRHLQPLSFVYQMIDIMALHKLNVLHWHLTEDQGWRIESKRYPQLNSIGSWRKDSNSGNRYGGFYTQSDLKKIVKYALDRNITIVPEFEMPGHASAAVVSLPEIASAADNPKEVPTDFGVLPYLMNPASPKTYEFVHNVIDEIVEIFPGPMIHIGGDEAIKEQWKKSPEIQALIKKLDVSDETALQDWFMAQIATYIESKGRIAVGYFYPGAVPQKLSVPVEVYLPENPSVELLRKGHRLVELMYPEMYLDLRQSDKFKNPDGIEDLNTLSNVYTFDPIFKGLNEEETSRIMGVEGALWTENVPNTSIAMTQTFPRELAVSEVAWTPASKRNWSDFTRRLEVETSRFEKLGLEMSDMAFRPQVVIHRHAPGAPAEISVTNETGSGDIRFTLDGTEPTSSSPVLASSSRFVSPGVLSATTFARDGRKLSQTIRRKF